MAETMDFSEADYKHRLARAEQELDKCKEALNDEARARCEAQQDRDEARDRIAEAQEDRNSAMDGMGRYRKERDAALAQVAALREALSRALNCAKVQWNMNPKNEGDEAGDVSKPGSLFRELEDALSDTAAAAQEWEKRVRREAAEAMRERCAAIASFKRTYADDYLADHPESEDAPEASGARQVAGEIAAAIRALDIDKEE